MRMKCPLYAFLLILNVVFITIASGSDRVFYAGGSGEQEFRGMLELSDGTFLVGGCSDDLSWLPSGTSTTSISRNATNGSNIYPNGVSEGKVAFILRVSADASTILECVHFPDGDVDQVQWIKTNTAPGEPTGDIFISGTWGKTSAGSKDGGFYVAKLTGNFINGTPSGLSYVWNIPTHGKNNEHAKIQPWDVFSDGRVVSIRYGSYRDNWGELIFFPADPATGSSNDTGDGGPTISPGMRLHSISNDGGATTQNHYGTGDTIPAGYSIIRSREILKTMRTGSSGLYRSFTSADYHHWEKDENGFWRKGKFPLDVMWNNYWRVPETNGSVNNMWGGDTRGYTGYKLAGTGGTEGAPYTPRVGAITIDKRNDHLYVGLNWQSRLPATNNPDFEPALIAYDGTGRLRWWARMYKEYNDDSQDGPQNLNATVSSVGSGTQITASSLAGTEINTNRKTGGSDGYINGYRRLYWLAGSANEHTYSNIQSYDSVTGTFTLVNAPSSTVGVNDPFMVDGTLMGKTHTSTPDQYVDAIAIDYSSPLNNDLEGILYVAARSHGNNVSNLWSGNSIKANPGGHGFVNNFTGNNGNAHYSWLGKYRDNGTSGTILAATFVGEYKEMAEFGAYGALGSAYSDPLLDFWPNHNGGWPDLNTTTVGYQMTVTPNGEVVILAKGRSVHTTSNAFQRNIRPKISGKVSAAASAQVITSDDLAGANLFLDNCKVKIDNEIRTVTAFDNATGEMTLDSPLSSTPSIGENLVVDEGIGSWGTFARVYSSDLSTLTYSTLLDSAIKPADGSGGGSNTKLHGVWALSNKIVVSGYHSDGTGEVVPTSDIPSWGQSTPDGQTAVFAILDTRAPIVDINSNEIPDSWENAHFGNTSNTPATVMKQGVQTPIYTVYVTDTDPNDPADVFNMTHISPDSVRFTSESTREYRLEYRTGLGQGDADWQPLTAWTIGTGSEMDLDPGMLPTVDLWFLRTAVRVP